MKIKIKHETHYKLEQPIRRASQYLRLTPRADRKQKIYNWSITGPNSLTEWTDGFGNTVHFAAEMEEHDEFSIIVEGEVGTTDTNGILPMDDGLPPIMFLRETPLTKLNRDMSRFSNKFGKVREKEGDIAMLHALMQGLHERLTLNKKLDDAPDPAQKAFKAKEGSSLDFAHLFIASCRHHEIPTRFVSGYKLGDNNHPIAHGWAESYIPNLGWVSFDPANSQSATDQYVHLAIGYDYASSAPIIGARNLNEEDELTVKLEAVQVQS